MELDLKDCRFAIALMQRFRPLRGGGPAWDYLSSRTTAERRVIHCAVSARGRGLVAPGGGLVAVNDDRYGGTDAAFVRAALRAFMACWFATRHQDSSPCLGRALSPCGSACASAAPSAIGDRDLRAAAT